MKHEVYTSNGLLHCSLILNIAPDKLDPITHSR
jgi:hypothetical protein